MGMYENNCKFGLGCEQLSRKKSNYTFKKIYQHLYGRKLKKNACDKRKIILTNFSLHQKFREIDFPICTLILMFPQIQFLYYYYTPAYIY